MIIPVRCFTCGTPMAQHWDEYCGRIAKKEDPKKVLDSLGLSRYCCRRMLLAHSDVIDEIMKYKRF
ncbi:MAG: DNA-directed RNA polymerase subunit N [Candidatus Altiarchaeota archaeon]|nr:DNA-directed RNA polymerase subunit N [Candidatus Altiarchaeota archaeon]